MDGMMNIIDSIAKETLKELNITPMFSQNDMVLMKAKSMMEFSGDKPSFNYGEWKRWHNGNTK